MRKKQRWDGTELSTEVADYWLHIKGKIAITKGVENGIVLSKEEVPEIIRVLQYWEANGKLPRK